MIFETHAHYDDEAFAQDRENLLASMQKHGIGHIVNACASVESLKDTEELMEKYPFCLWCIGIHPDDGKNDLEETLEEIVGYPVCKISGYRRNWAGLLAQRRTRA